MKFRSITNNAVTEAEQKHKQRINKMSNAEAIAELPLEFEPGDVVKLKSSKINYSTHYGEIKDEQFTVDVAKMADLEDMAVEVLYFKESNDNPFLASHFVKL